MLQNMMSSNFHLKNLGEDIIQERNEAKTHEIRAWLKDNHGYKSRISERKKCFCSIINIENFINFFSKYGNQRINYVALILIESSGYLIFKLHKLRLLKERLTTENSFFVTGLLILLVWLLKYVNFV
ncbi:hypothetical protein BpHYR1_004479 [Brachionus plicatilis]|uniref:Uncharacterized protein n=1 Tax=Brachionus plicatilis TaxID=10195 RepID=A0A3M7S9T6_BRAPC|nr:hypothetical protein BpHYR1_004479 [Brachionus plicatilis]